MKWIYDDSVNLPEDGIQALTSKIGVLSVKWRKLLRKKKCSSI